MISAFWRRWLLPFTIVPLLPATLVNLFAGREWALLGCLLGIALPMGATWLMRRGRAGDAQVAALAMGGAAALVAFLAAEAGPVASLLLGAGAWGGTRLLYSGVSEIAPPAEAPVAPPAPEDALSPARLRLVPLIETGRACGVPRLAAASVAIGALVDEFARRPERLAEARRYLDTNLDGLERIAARLRAGAEPPPGLAALLGEVEEGARDLARRLREHDSAALAVQVQVLGEKLRGAGYG